MKEEIYNYIVEQINAKIEQKKSPFSVSVLEVYSYSSLDNKAIKTALNELFKEGRIKVYEGAHSKFIYLESIQIMP